MPKADAKDDSDAASDGVYYEVRSPKMDVTDGLLQSDWPDVLFPLFGENVKCGLTAKRHYVRKNGSVIATVKCLHSKCDILYKLYSNKCRTKWILSADKKANHEANIPRVLRQKRRYDMQLKLKTFSPSEFRAQLAAAEEGDSLSSEVTMHAEVCIYVLSYAFKPFIYQ